jgi:hypothetical protein
VTYISLFRVRDSKLNLFRHSHLDELHEDNSRERLE